MKNKDVGVKVLISTKDVNGNIISGDGYILRRLNVDTYEIWSENLQSVLILDKEDFTEI